MAIPKHFLDELRARVNLVELVGRTVQLKKRGRDHWGCCPFHGEKTPSFKVSEDREDYHCFGCGAHGSAFDFVMQTESLSFPEAIERLADLTGMVMPEVTPQDRQQADRMTRLSEANEAAARWFTAQLHGTVGAEARDYIARRGLSQKAVEEFRIGFAPDRNDGLKSALIERGFSDEELIEAGLIAKPDDGRASYDRFRNRLMFPIGDRRGRVIAFGGRALGDARAKYLNSPETPLFSKSLTLYNFAMAREASRDAGTVIVAEGYMDVIALAEAGFRNAVAPLGTAVTEEQIGMLWQMTAEPVLCLDGDDAGLRAAQRAAERALPILKPGKSLRFALLPEGLDPDDLIRQQGPKALEKILMSPHPLHETIFEAAFHGIGTETPEKRAELLESLLTSASSIQHATVSLMYKTVFRNLYWERLKSLSNEKLTIFGDRFSKYRSKADLSVETGENLNINLYLDVLTAIIRDRAISMDYSEVIDEFEYLIENEEYSKIMRAAQGWAETEIPKNDDSMNVDAIIAHLKNRGNEIIVNHVERSRNGTISDPGHYRWMGSAKALASSALAMLFIRKFDDEFYSEVRRLIAEISDIEEKFRFQKFVEGYAVERYQMNSRFQSLFGETREGEE